jgi:hypothetical protein
MRCGRLSLSFLGALVLATGAVAAAQAAPPKKARNPRKLALAATKTQATAVGLDNAHIALSWNTVPGAASYRVSRGTLVVGTTAVTTFTDTLLWPSTQYSYKVDALSPTGAVLSSLTARASTKPLPASGFPSLFPAGSLWNTPVGNTPTAPNSAGELAYILARVKNPNMTMRAWGVAVAEARPTDPTYSVPCLVYQCTLSAFGSFAIPSTAAPDPSSDAQLAVYDPTSRREWDMWQAARGGSGWTSSAGAGVSLDGNGVAPAGTASGDASNLPLLGGLIRPEEILQGHIDHALVFSMPGVSDLGHVCPATHNDGSTNDPNAPMEGTRLQLDPSVNVDLLGLPSWEKPIVRAMQQYGMYLRDGGASFAIYGENPISRGYDAWSKVGMPGGDQAGLAGIPWSKLRVVAAPASC